MQLLFPFFCVFQSSSPEGFDEIFSLITYENQLFPLSKFSVKYLSDSTWYTVIIVIWMMLMVPVNPLARWWPCLCLNCVSGLRRLWKTWTFSDAYKSLSWCSNIVHPKMTDSSYSFSFTSKFWWIKLPHIREWNDFVCFSGVRLKFSRIAMSRKGLQRE